MLKIVVLDSGYGGELFADRLEENLNIAEIIRVIDWRNSKKYIYNKYESRKAAENAILPYIGKVDLIILANYYLSISSLKYFIRKYPEQQFVGLKPTLPCKFLERDVLILATTAIAKSMAFRNYVSNLHARTKIFTLDDWPEKIDDGTLTEGEIGDVLKSVLLDEGFRTDEIITMCSQFWDIKNELKNLFGKRVVIHDSFEDTLTTICKTLKLRGGSGRKRL